MLRAERDCFCDLGERDGRGEMLLEICDRFFDGFTPRFDGSAGIQIACEQKEQHMREGGNDLLAVRVGVTVFPFDPQKEVFDFLRDAFIAVLIHLCREQRTDSGRDVPLRTVQKLARVDRVAVFRVVQDLRRNDDDVSRNQIVALAVNKVSTRAVRDEIHLCQIMAVLTDRYLARVACNGFFVKEKLLCAFDRIQIHLGPSASFCIIVSYEVKKIKKICVYIKKIKENLAFMMYNGSNNYPL